MRGEGKTGEPEIVLEILGYLVENPEAQDTFEGIVEWWLLERSINRETRKVKEALADLIAKGLVLEQKGSDLRWRYQINRRKLRQIRTLLKREGRL
jgi:hypothetical protein